MDKEALRQRAALRAIIEHKKKVENFVPQVPEEKFSEALWDFTKVGKFDHGLEAVGTKQGNQFVKQPKNTSKLRKKLAKELEILEDFDIAPEKSMLHRVALHEMLGDVGLPTYYYGKEGAETISQPYSKPLKTLENFEKASIDKIQPKVFLDDLHQFNVGISDGEYKVLDVGHSKPLDYDEYAEVLEKVKTTKNLGSASNKALRMSYAKKLAKRLPVIASLISAYDFIDNPAQAAYDSAVGSLGGVEGLGGDLPPEVERQRKKYNAMMMNMRGK